VKQKGRVRCEKTMAITLSLSEVKTRLPELVAGVQEREEEVVVTKNGRPAAVLITVDENTRLKETLNVLSDPVLLKQISQSKSFYGSGRNGLTFEDVFREPFTSVKKRRTA
jgi:prevent-host-death family protein